MLFTPDFAHVNFVSRLCCRDAWDVMPYHLETGRPAFTCCSVDIVENGPIRAVVAVTARMGTASAITQRIILPYNSESVEFHCEVSPLVLGCCVESCCRLCDLHVTGGLARGPQTSEGGVPSERALC